MNPETALHPNVKFFLASVLERTIGGDHGLRVRRRCTVGHFKYESGDESTWVESTSPACSQVDDALGIESWDK